MLAESLRIAPATRLDYTRLAHHHYRAGLPATVALILGAWLPDGPPEPLGVLVVSMPVLNAPWRAAVWPNRFARAGKRHSALAANRSIRCISRVVVDPRARASGIATALVRRYLADPLTPCTEAIAAMSAHCPLFARAGMRSIPLRPSAADARFLQLLRARRVGALHLACPAIAARRFGDNRTLHRSLRTWADASGGTRRARDGTLHQLLTLAAARLAVRRAVFIAGPDSPANPPETTTAPALV